MNKQQFRETISLRGEFCEPRTFHLYVSPCIYKRILKTITYLDLDATPIIIPRLNIVSNISRSVNSVLINKEV